MRAVLILLNKERKTQKATPRQVRKAKALKVKSRLQPGARGRQETPLTGDRHRATRAAHTGPTFDLATSHMPGRRGLSNNHPTRPYGLTSTTVGESVILSTDGHMWAACGGHRVNRPHQSFLSESDTLSTVTQRPQNRGIKALSCVVKKMN